jgi:alpha-1,6-mannosyltransferase
MYFESAQQKKEENHYLSMPDVHCVDVLPTVMSQRLLIVVGIVMEACYLSFYFAVQGADEVLLFIAVNVATFLLLSFIIWRMKRAELPPGNRIAVIILGMGLLFRLTLVPHGVVGSDDIYRYLWDGKVACSGINPYLYLPTDPHLSHLATADLPSKVNHTEMRSVYPAVAQALFFASYGIFGESTAGLKFLLVVVDFLTMLLLWKLLCERGGSVFPLILYAWSPLPILYFGLDGHIDALGILFLVFSLVFFLKRRTVLGAVALGLAALSRLVPLLFVPLLLRTATGVRRLFILIAPFVVVGVGYLLYFEPTWGIVESLRTFGSRWEFNGGIFSVAYFLTGSNETAHVISGIEIVLCIGLLTLLDRPLLEKVFWGFTGFILLSPVVHPWYLTWLGALLVLRWSTSVYVFLGLSFVANIVVYRYRLFGVWNDQPLLLLLEYVPVFILLVQEVLRKEVLRAVPESQK